MYKVSKCRLRMLRNNRGWTQDELSSRSGISKSSISSFETEKRQMKLESAKNLVHALSCEFDDLYTWERRR